MKVAIYPGSFDPITNGHIDILKKMSPIFDKIIVAVVHNITKQALFTPEERVNLIKESTVEFKNIEVDCFSGLLTDYVKEKKFCCIIRGLRSVTDFEYEFNMCMMNKKLLPNVNTIFVMSDSDYIFVSSSNIKEASLLGGDVSSLVPAVVEQGLKRKIKALMNEN